MKKKRPVSSSAIPSSLISLTLVTGGALAVALFAGCPGATSALAQSPPIEAMHEQAGKGDEETGAGEGEESAEIEEPLRVEEEGVLDAGLDPNDPAGIAPAQDVCSGAGVISTTLPALSNPVDIFDASTTGDPPLPGASCTGATTMSRSVWFRFTPTANGSYSFSMCSSETGTTVPDLVLALYTSTGGCSGPFTSVACDDNSCLSSTQQPRFVKNLTAGTTYYAVAWKADNTAPAADQRTVQLRVNRVFPAANDTCASASPLSLNRFTTRNYGDLRNDYQLAAASPCFPATAGQVANTASGLDAVYSFTAPTTGSYSFKVWNVSTGANPVLYLANACPAANSNAPVTVTCSSASNRSNNAEEINCIALTAGQTVYLFVDQTTPANGPTYFVQVEDCQGSESESNGTTGTADAIQCGIMGSIGPNGEADFFALGTVAIDSRIFAMVDAGASSNSTARMRVTTTTDTLEYDLANATSPWGLNAPLVGGTIGTGVATFLRLSNFTSTDTTEPYHLYAVIQPPLAQATAESEPNDMLDVTDAAANNYFYGSLGGPAPSFDTDIYGFTANAGDLIYIGLDGDPLRDNTPVNAAITVADATGTIFLVANDDTSTSDTTSGAGTLTSLTPSSPAEGVLFRAPVTSAYYVIIICGTTQSVPAGAGDYLLSITKNCALGGGGIPHPGINLTKLTNGTNNNSAPGVFVPVGSTVTFTYVVTNTGDSPLSGVTVRDNNGTAGTASDDFNATFVGGDTNDNDLLDLSETFVFTASRIATAGQYTNVGTASGTGTFGIPVSATDADNHFGAQPAINLVKLTNATNNNSPPGLTVPVGSTVTFNYLVTNTGNVQLAGVTVQDDNGTPGSTADDFNATFSGGDTNGNGLLDTTETFTFTATRTATAGQYTNIGTASGTGPSGPPAVSDTDPDNHFGQVAPTPTPTPTPPTVLGNISTRLRVETGDNVLIGGFIVTGSQPKKVIVRGIGTSLGLANKLQNPILELHGPSGLIEANDDWKDSPNRAEIEASGIPPIDDLESAIVATLAANGTGYTAILRGVNNGTGIGVVEAYDLDLGVNSTLANISTRGFVQTADNILIAGTIVVGPSTRKVLIRAIGPSLSVPGKLEDPTLELRDQNGSLVRANDNWKSDQEAEIIATTIPPIHDSESALVETLQGNNSNYTAIVRGVNNITGIAVVEIYALDN